ncbi:alpha/beta hydrolase [Arthrobacter sp. NtRootA4]|uniref:alpha/beta fold hydrolase n=1 Tax=Paenarthrobacter nicotinovorans TaxID=29320 RepID=UPI001E6B8563|nr:alpha/beta hydrolase [Arthrobacter sp. NtRootA2]BCW14989.1 alpha/beta hydrolase [Arthrobacter sp. NtRootA4]BCW23324.1 alpha/beta hydrolase [Arthrobacter sp. NtRootC7]BCW27592.1 alpha/beta hydrolase [Arthrobacter sp. NtRootC45]BCW31859.1 alpha/beta hydrolase [Arthrobacter sp. NtRootD5]
MEKVDTAHSPEGSQAPNGFFSEALAGRTTASDIEVDRSTVAYWTYEPAKATSTTRTILVIHGFRGDHHGLLRVVDQLPEMRIIMPDLPAFGSSEPFVDDEHTVERYGQFISSFMTALGLGPRTVLLGHSFGSIVASHFAAAHPYAIYPLILINPIAAPALEGPKGIMTKLAVLYYQASARLPRRVGLAVLRNRLIVRVMSITMAKTKDKALRRFIHGQHDAYFSAFADRKSLLESFKASVSGNVAEVAEQLRLPVLLVAGEKDEIATLPNQHKLMERLPDATLEVIPDVGHLIHYETPAPAAAAIRTFLEEHPA